MIIIDHLTLCFIATCSSFSFDNLLNCPIIFGLLPSTLILVGRIQLCMRLCLSLLHAFTFIVICIFDVIFLFRIIMLQFNFFELLVYFHTNESDKLMFDFTPPIF